MKINYNKILNILLILLIIFQTIFTLFPGIYVTNKCICFGFLDDYIGYGSHNLGLFAFFKILDIIQIVLYIVTYLLFLIILRVKKKYKSSLIHKILLIIFIVWFIFSEVLQFKNHNFIRCKQICSCSSDPNIVC